jgi:phosphotransferase system  glucose/maltose/N-acetylglucosamine-specific IIC component
MKLNGKAFALAAAILSGVASFLLTLLSVLTGFAKEFFDIIAPFHPGYSPYKHSFIGALISGIWMFVYGYIFGAVFTALYNSLVKEAKE